MKLSLKPSPAFVRDMTDGHSILGLALSTLLYIVCVSGTLAVFYNEFERWEQADEREVLAVVEPSVYRSVTENAMALAAERGEALKSVTFTIPNSAMPRLTVRAGGAEYYVGQDGTLQDEVAHDWTHFLTYLHFALNLPVVLGVPLVGLIGVLMTALILSGLLAHPNIIRDAFSLRMAGSRRLQQVDLHNRLGVWASPFHLAIAVTGAFIGLSQVVAFAVAGLFYGGNVEKVESMLYIEKAVIEEDARQVPLADFSRILAEMSRLAPEQEQNRLRIFHPGREGQAVEISTRVPGRLIWGERYRFDAEGRLLHQEGWSDGNAGKQVYASTFRLHFGHFSGFLVKIAYFLLGVGMCVLVVSGINIWFLRKRQRGEAVPRLERVWVAQVWGIPFAIALSAVTYLAFAIAATPVFWIVVLVLSVVAAFVGTVAGWSMFLRGATIAACLLAVVVHGVMFGTDSFVRGALVANGVWLLTAAGIGVSCLYTLSRQRSGSAAGVTVNPAIQ
ncbi:PepSY-associated TM helix domain-containing protein [Microbulbifer sp. 2201CG32-9]|uniref:PepSY-associated TM helix domain-containing protein n=1 Tax=Microbulbifer sp. 2201CG32-9 TaxID=3232309 RepID=UPI00345B5328